jgi:hypothetical protein
MHPLRYLLAGDETVHLKLARAALPVRLLRLLRIRCGRTLPPDSDCCFLRLAVGAQPAARSMMSWALTFLSFFFASARSSFVSPDRYRDTADRERPIFFATASIPPRRPCRRQVHRAHSGHRLRYVRDRYPTPRRARGYRSARHSSVDRPGKGVSGARRYSTFATAIPSSLTPRRSKDRWLLLCR